MPLKTAHVSPTAWLDGMRGYAAFIVFLRHYEFAYHRKGFLSYGTAEDASFPNENKHFLQLPIIRLISQGEAMVIIFFVISGYVLSSKSIKCMRKADHEQLSRTIASSILRRPFRLFLPCIVSTLIVFFALRIGIYDRVNQIAGPDDVYRSIFLGWAHDPQPYVLPTFWDQAQDWMHQNMDFFDIFTHRHWPQTLYDIHLWTIPVEFRCSLVLFLTIAGLSRVRSKARMTILVIMIALSFHFDAWELGMFWGGMLLAEMTIVRQEKLDNKIHNDPFSVEAQSPNNSWPSLATYFGFVLALFLLSYPPQKARFAPGYSTLEKLIPSGLRQEDRYRFWHCMGALLLVWTTSRETCLQRIFSCSLGRYLGNISYALYLMHGFVLKTVGYLAVYSFWEYTGKETLFQYELGFVLGGLVVIPLTVYLSDLFWKHVDMPIVRFTRWLENKLLDVEPEAEPILIEK